jgi:hypothetical protein
LTSGELRSYNYRLSPGELDALGAPRGFLKGTKYGVAFDSVFSGTISCDFYEPKSRQCGPAAVRFSHRVYLGILAVLGPGLSHPVQVLDIVPKSA